VRAIAKRTGDFMENMKIRCEIAISRSLDRAIEGRPSDASAKVTIPRRSLFQTDHRSIDKSDSCLRNSLEERDRAKEKGRGRGVEDGEGGTTKATGWQAKRSRNQWTLLSAISPPLPSSSLLSLIHTPAHRTLCIEFNPRSVTVTVTLARRSARVRGAATPRLARTQQKAVARE